MKHSQSIEDYLENILLLSRESQYVHRVDVARRVGVSPPAVQKAIKILTASGFVECDGMHLRLTRKGAEYAESIYERHCNIRAFLILLGVNEEDADADACEMEHIVSDSTYAAMKEFLNKNGK